MYRQTALRALDREVVAVHAPDAWYLKRGLTAPVVVAALESLEQTLGMADEEAEA